MKPCFARCRRHVSQGKHPKGGPVQLGKPTTPLETDSVLCSQISVDLTETCSADQSQVQPYLFSFQSHIFSQQKLQRIKNLALQKEKMSQPRQPAPGASIDFNDGMIRFSTYRPLVISITHFAQCLFCVIKRFFAHFGEGQIC